MQQRIDQSSKSVGESRQGRAGSCQNIPRTAGQEEYNILLPGSKQEGTDTHVEQKFILVLTHLCLISFLEGLINGF